MGFFLLIDCLFLFIIRRTHSQITQVIREYRKTGYRVPMAVLVCLIDFALLCGLAYFMVNQDQISYLTGPSSLCKASRKHYCTNRHVLGKDNVDDEWYVSTTFLPSYYSFQLRLILYTNLYSFSSRLLLKDKANIQCSEFK